MVFYHINRNVVNTPDRHFRGFGVTALKGLSVITGDSSEAPGRIRVTKITGTLEARNLGFKVEPCFRFLESILERE